MSRQRHPLYDWERCAIELGYAAGEKTAALAAEFNVCHQLVSRIAKRAGLALRLGRPQTRQEFAAMRLMRLAVTKRRRSFGRRM